jgi:hypothetical protein
MKVRSVVSRLTRVSAALILACSPTMHAARQDAAGTPAAQAPSSAARPSSGGVWVPRIAPAPSLRGSKFFGPLTNNYGTALTAYLGRHRAGLLHDGHRFVWDNGVLSDIDPRDRPGLGLDAVVPIEPGLGGGFVFSGEHGVFFADAFDAPLRTLSDRRAELADFAVAPHSVLIDGKLISTKDGKAVPGAPDNVALYAHRNGFAVALTFKPPVQCWFTSEGQAWRPIAVTNADGLKAVEDGDALLLFDSETRRSMHVGKDGQVTSVTLSQEELSSRQLAGFFAKIPTACGAEEPFEGSLWDAGWVATGRSDDEWFRVEDNRVCVAHTRTGERGCFDPKVGKKDESCSAMQLGTRPLLFCFTESLSVWIVDLATGATQLEKAIEHPLSPSTNFHFVGAPRGAFPPALIAEVGCDGADTGLCVRGADGVWKTVAKPKEMKSGMLLAFPGEAMWLTQSDAGELRVNVLGSSRVRTFSSVEVASRYEEMGLLMPLSKNTAPRVVTEGTLRTAAGIRIFFGPNPTAPVAEGARSFALDVPLDDKRTLAITGVAGVVAVAGLHALRLADGKLWETNDGWSTWYEVAPPPTGVPRDLSGAMCDDRGCAVGAWARLGWTRLAAETPHP